MNRIEIYAVFLVMAILIATILTININEIMSDRVDIDSCHEIENECDQYECLLDMGSKICNTYKADILYLYNNQCE